MAPFNRHRCWLLFFVLFYFLLSHKRYHSLGLRITLEILCWVIIILIFIIIFFFHHNGVISMSPLFIAIFSHISFLPPHWWVRLLVGIVDYIGSTFLSDDIIAILLYIIITLIGWIKWYQIYLWLLFQWNGTASPSLMFIVVFVLSFHTRPLSDRNRHVTLYSD